MVAGVLARGMLGGEGRGRNAFWAGWRVRRSAIGKAGPFVRPDSSQSWGEGASAPGVLVVPARVAAEDDLVRAGRARRGVRLGAVLAGLARDLAAARREIAVLKRENVALRERLDAGA